MDKRKSGRTRLPTLADAPVRSKENPIRRYVALDDEIEPILAVIPRHHVFACDPWHGLTGEVANRVIRHFAAPETPSKPVKPPKTTKSSRP